MNDAPLSQTTDADACRACHGRGYLGEPRVIYPEPQIGDDWIDPAIRYAVERCPVCNGSGRR